MDIESQCFIGLMSGTSADGVDGALVSFADQQPTGQQPQIPVQVLATTHLDYDEALRNRLYQLYEPGGNELQHAGLVANQLSVVYARVIESLLQESGIQKVAAVGCHGQTVRHYPETTPGFSIQLVNGGALATRSGQVTITDFRNQDMAAAGQGAPLAPAFHHAFLQTTQENRCVVNLGGIANVTYLDQDPNAPVIGFDTGPANCLIDTICQTYFGKRYDEDGALAAQGSVQTELLQRLLQDGYFARPYPKSTGRDYFNLSWLKGYIADQKLASADTIATLTALSAKSIADGIQLIQRPVNRLYLCGGGANNATLKSMIEQYTGIDTFTSEDLGIDPQIVEAVAFAWMAYRRLAQLPNTIASVTGANRSVCAGCVYLP